VAVWPKADWNALSVFSVSHLLSSWPVGGVEKSNFKYSRLIGQRLSITFV
jgi:hypothetical protein